MTVSSTLRPMFILGALFGQALLAGSTATLGADLKAVASLGQAQAPVPNNAGLNAGLMDSLPGAALDTAERAPVAPSAEHDSAAAAPMRAAATAAAATAGASVDSTAAAAPALPREESIEDLEVRVMSLLATSTVRFLMESPLSCALKAADWLAEKSQHAPDSHHAKVVALISALGVPVNGSSHKLQQQNQHTMFGGIPWILLMPVVAGTALVIFIQAVSMWSEYKEQAQKGPGTGEPYEADLGY